MRPRLTRALGLGLTVVFLALALQRVDVGAFARELGQVNYAWILPSAVCTLLGYVLRTVRWRVILSGTARAPLRTLFPLLMMGFATNNLLPGRLGEFWRAYLLGRKRNVPKSSALASVVVERVFDGLTLIALLGLVSIAIRLPGWSRDVEVLAAIVFASASVLVCVLVWRPGLAYGLSGYALRPLPERYSRFLELRLTSFVDGLAALRQPQVLASATALSVGVWLLEFSSYVLLSRGVNLGLPSLLQLPALGLALVTINLGIMVPSGPGYVGTQEFFGTAALGVVEANPAAALALVAVSHVVQYVVVTTLGLAFFAREHLSPGSARELRAGLVEEPA